jgi:hypothetical protein
VHATAVPATACAGASPLMVPVPRRLGQAVTARQCLWGRTDLHAHCNVQIHGRNREARCWPTGRLALVLTFLLSTLRSTVLQRLAAERRVHVYRHLQRSGLTLNTVQVLCCDNVLHLYLVKVYVALRPMR